MECLTHLLEDIALGNAACVALIDGRAKRLQLGLVEPLLALQSAQGGAHPLAGVLKAPALYPRQNEAVEFLSQIHVASWHRASPVSPLGEGD